MIELQTAEEFEYVSSHKQYGVKEGTLVSEIASTLSIDGILDVEDPVKILEYVNSVEAHTVCMAQAKETIVRSVRQLSDLVKNTINPHIVRVVKCVSDWTDTSTSAGIAIEQVSLPDNLKRDFIKSLAFKYKDIPTPTVSQLGHGMGEISIDQAKAALNLISSSGSFIYAPEDNVLGKALAFCINGDYEASLADINVALTVMLLATGISSPGENVQMPLTTWEINRNAIINKAAKWLIKAYVDYGRAVENKALYIGPRNAKKVVVNKDVYAALVELGSAPEILLGNEYLGRKHRSVALFTDEAAREDCKKAFTLNEAAIARKSEVEARRQRTRTIAGALLSDAKAFAENDSWPVQGDSLERAKGRINVVFNKLMNGPLRDGNLDDLVAAVILAVYYAHTDAWRLISIAQDLLKDDPELNADEAYSLAKIEYVGQYIAAQLTLKEER